MSLEKLDQGFQQPIVWKELLDERRRVLLKSEKEIVHRALVELSGDNTGEISKSRSHAADLATDTQEIETLQILSQNNRRRLQEIHAALDRLEKGTFGLCQICEEPIAVARLKILPESRYCYECEKELEQNMKKNVETPMAEVVPIKGPISDAVGDTPVSAIMQSNPISAESGDSIETAVNLMAKNDIRHLPVVDSEGELLGILSDRDLFGTALRLRPGKNGESEKTWRQQKVDEVMTRSPETVEPDTSLHEAGMILVENKISCLPVVEGTRLVGIITDSDFVKLVSLSA